MEIDELRDLDNEQLSKELNESQREFMNLRFRTSTMQLTNVHQVRKIRKRIARINTIMRERELART